MEPIHMRETCSVQVIVPLYRAETTLRACLDSLLAQTCSDWQAILIDDASPDGSLAIAREYAALDARFVVLENARNCGVSGTRNRGLDVASAEYVTFLDSDDRLEPETIATMLGEAREGDFDVVQCRFIYDFPGGKQLLPRGAFRHSTTLEGRGIIRAYRKMSTGINLNHVCMKLVRRSVIGEQRFDTALRTGEDLAFCAELFTRVKRYRFLDAPFYHYTRGGSVSLTSGGVSARDKWAANQRAAERIRAALRTLGVRGGLDYVLTYLRVYLVTISKIFRTMREKFILR